MQSLESNNTKYLKIIKTQRPKYDLLTIVVLIFEYSVGFVLALL